MASAAESKKVQKVKVPSVAPNRRSGNALAADATDEQVFARDWLTSHLHLGSEADSKEWQAVYDQGDCEKIEGSELSSQLRAAWLVEKERQKQSRIKAEYEQADLAAKSKKKQAVLRARRRESSTFRKEIGALGLVELKEKKVGLDRLAIDLTDAGGASEAAAELQAAVGDQAVVAEALQFAELNDMQIVTRKTATALHGASAKPLKPLATGTPTFSATSTSRGVKRQSPPKKDADSTDEDEEQKSEPSPKKAKVATKTTKPSVPSSDKVKIDALFAKTLATIAKERVANPIITTAETFAALQTACEQHVLHPPERGFAGSALAPPAPPFY